MTVDVSYDARTGAAVEEVAVSTPFEVDTALAAAAAAAPGVAATPPVERARLLRALADALEGRADELVALADRETGLGEERLRMEIGRAAGQLRYHADVAVEGSYLDVTIDTGAPRLARTGVPLGPVAVFGASNFPFLFGVLGTDTAAALAAGCPVVVKANPAQPVLSARLRLLAADVLPAGWFALVSGFEAGGALVASPHTAAVAFTGSQRGGLALWRLANERDVVIPVFAEMGTVNPVVVTAAALSRADELARGFVESFTRGTGQYCTKPGLLFVPAGSGMAGRVAAALVDLAPEAWLLTEQIAASAATGLAELVAAGGTVAGQAPGPGNGWTTPTTVLSAPIEKLRSGSRLLEECFGPVAIVTEYADRAELEHALGELQGTLAAAVMAGEDDQDVPWLVERLTALAGRVTVGDWPTGVAVTGAQHHGGPWPATTRPATTSVGAGALSRFTRPVAYQNVPDAALPPPLRAGNPWRLPRRVDGVVTLP
ncbi:aldehyde dehydrogenase family protein [Actinophytocola glycyrrhizae]|uniref:Aldehyde dehydrogenase family protein n=1 Tax=Actinophytocola glycyrrhizae TaxID=2044873 RepID=A0ABV9RW12_9PSEU